MRLPEPSRFKVVPPTDRTLGELAGQMGGGGILTLLARMIGWQRASELIFTGKLIPAEEAESIGLVNRVVPPDELMAAGL